MYAGMNDHMSKHGDGVKDIAFQVDDLEGILKVSRGSLITSC